MSDDPTAYSRLLSLRGEIALAQTRELSLNELLDLRSDVRELRLLIAQEINDLDRYKDEVCEYEVILFDLGVSLNPYSNYIEPRDHDELDTL